jgi:ribosomal-protein-alanine N-acetyltransferase
MKAVAVLPRWISRRRSEGPAAGPYADDRVSLRSPEFDDYRQWRDLRSASRRFLTPWEPIWPSDDLTRSAFAARIRRHERERLERSGFAYFLFGRESGELLGGINLSHVRMGSARSAMLGYWMGEAHAGKGLMKRGLRLLLPVAFGEIGLMRLEAVCLPENTRSLGLLETLGFKREGIVREYLEINGQRRDHLLLSMIAREAPARPDRQPR